MLARQFMLITRIPPTFSSIIKSSTDLYEKKFIFGIWLWGDRDPKKRKQMGEIADRYADRVVITDDNPRFEDPKLERKSGLMSGGEEIEIAKKLFVLP